jgi:TM2 domain-containing membrane protein YozV
MTTEFTPMEQQMMVKDLTDQQKMLFMGQYESVKKDPGTILVLSILFGFSGIDRFMLGDMGLGIAKLLTLGGCGIWAMVDWFTAKSRANAYNRAKAQEVYQAIKMTAV